MENKHLQHIKFTILYLAYEKSPTINQEKIATDRKNEQKI